MKRRRTSPRGWSRAGLSTLIAIATLSIGRPTSVEAHPIHTTLARITREPGSQAVVVSLRVFADDFGVAVGRHAGIEPGPDHSVAAGAAYDYVRSTFTLSDASGRAIPLAWCGARRTGDVVWLCLRGSAPTPKGFRVLSSLLFEVHDDQVNIVQSTLSGKSSSMVFTRGDRARALP